MENKKALFNICCSIKEADDDTIIVLLDGDDWIANTNVLAKLNETYDDDVWITAGSYMDNLHGIVTSPNINPAMWDKNIRKYYYFWAFK